MFSDEVVKSMLDGAANLNSSMGSFAVFLPVGFAVVVIGLLLYCYRNPGEKSSTALLWTLALIYIFSGWTIFLVKTDLGAAVSWAGTIALWIVAILLILDGFFHWTRVRFPERLDLRILSLFFMVSGIFLYPLLEIALGFTWPGMALFSAECPTTIFLIGLFIGCIPRVNKPLFVIVSLNAIATGFSVAIHGAPFDYLYGLAGLAGLAMLVKNFKVIFLHC